MKSKNIIYNIPISNIFPHPDNPRKDLGDLTELTESIKKSGVMQNLTIVPEESEDGEQKYTVIIGHRRLAAAKAAGIAEVPCRIIEDMTDREQMAMMLEENMQRNDLTIVEQAQGFQMMLDLGSTEQEIAEKTGFSKTTVHHRLELAKLDKKILEKKTEDNSFQLNLTDLYELEKVKNPKTRDKILKDSYNSSNIRFAVNQEIERQKIMELSAPIIEKLENMGVKKAPSKMSPWDNNVDKIWQVDVRDKGTKTVDLKGRDGNLYWKILYNDIMVLEQVEKKEADTEAEEKKLKYEQRQKHKEELNSLASKLTEQLLKYARTVTKYDDKPKGMSEAAMTDMLLSQAFENDVILSTDNLYEAYTNKDSFEATESDKSLVLGLDSMYKLLLVNIDALRGSVADYYCGYNSAYAKKIIDAVDIMKHFGYIMNHEFNDMIYGTSDLYEKAGE